MYLLLAIARFSSIKVARGGLSFWHTSRLLLLLSVLMVFQLNLPIFLILEIYF